MSNTEAEPIIAPAPAPDEPATEATTAPAASGTYPMSRDGRRQAIILLLGVISIWVFALWSFIAIFPDGVTGVEWVTGALMLGIILVAPIVAWTLLEEANARITTDDQSITYSTFGGLKLTYAWADIAGFKGKGRKGRLARFFLGDEDGDSDTAGDDKASKIEENSGPVVAGEGEDEETTPEDEPDTVLLALRKDPATQIANPVVRFLHKQAHGDALPVYGGLENRKALLDEISSHIIK
jgi:hypothetical protein